MSTLLVNLAGLLLMAAIVWWFWLPGSGEADGNETANNEHDHH